MAHSKIVFGKYTGQILLDTNERKKAEIYRKVNCMETIELF